jgi:hypothetical protein
MVRINLTTRKMPKVLNKPCAVLGTTILHGATVFIVKLASGVITLVCAKNLKNE